MPHVVQCRVGRGGTGRPCCTPQRGRALGAVRHPTAGRGSAGRAGVGRAAVAHGEGSIVLRRIQQRAAILAGAYRARPTRPHHQRAVAGPVLHPGGMAGCIAGWTAGCGCGCCRCSEWLVNRCFVILACVSVVGRLVPTHSSPAGSTRLCHPALTRRRVGTRCELAAASRAARQ